MENTAPPDDGTSILVVDDRRENLEALVAVLEPLGCRIVTAGSGREALRLLLDERFAVILLDVQMPDMDGFETAGYIRDRLRTRTIPIIFLSAISTNSEHVFRGYEAGAVDYIVKPIDPVAIRSKVRVFVELFRRGEEIQRQGEALRLRDLEQARRESESRRHRRAAFLNSLSFALERRTDTAGRIGQLVRSCVPAFADFALVEVYADTDRSSSAALASARRADQRVLRELLRSHRASTPGSAAERSRVEAGIGEAGVLEALPGVIGECVWERLAPRSLIVVPLALGGRPLGRVVFVRGATGAYGDEELELAEELAQRASMAIETSRLYELERERSRTLQLSLLGESAIAHPLVTAASRYVPGSADLEVGGDWCDVVERDDGRIFAVVGDVVGRGIRAATAMGKLRSAIGALALVTDDTAALLERLDQFARRIAEADLATVICVLIDPASGTVSYSSAGHLPALVVGEDGEARFLEDGRGYPLGVDVGAPREQGYATIEAPSTLLLFTDGLIETPSRPIEQGLERLREAALARASQEPERLCDELLEELIDGPSDDVAVVCLRLDRSPVESQVWRFPALPSQIAVARHALAAWLEERQVPETLSNDLVLALVEACSNAVRHAYGELEGTVTVQLRRDEESLTIRVRDTGRWTAPLRSADGGWGLEIMRALVDDLHIHGTPYGTTVIMHKRLPAGMASPRRSRRAVSAPG